MKKLKTLALLFSALSLLSLFGCQNPSNGPLPEPAIPAEIEVENNTITFVQVPDAKSIPEEVVNREIYMYFPSGECIQIDWTDDPLIKKSSTYFYPFVEANNEYEIEVKYNSTKVAINRVKVTPKGGLGGIIPVNFSDVAAKIEGTDFIWVTKPVIIGNNTKGKILINFYDGWSWKDTWIGSVKVNYSTVKTSSHKGFSLIKENNENISDFSVFSLVKDPATVETLVVQYCYQPDDGSGDYAGYENTSIVFQSAEVPIVK